MPTVRLKIEAAGPLTTIQDGGRTGYRRYGVPPSGPVDRFGFAAAQARVGNNADDPALELSLGGVRLTCVEGEVGFVLGGAGFAAKAGSAKIDAGILRPGMTLAITHTGGGNWGYLALGGELQVDRWLGSAATHALAGLGGGRIVAGQVLEIITAERPAAVSLAEQGPPPDKITKARIILGPQDRHFPAAALTALCGQPFAASARLDRMGMVLNGPDLSPKSLDMISEPAVRGALQVNGTGEVTMLLADHQTTGGYPKIAVVIDPDIDRIAQLPPGSSITFTAITAMEAVVITRRTNEENAACLADLRDISNLAERLMSRNLVDGMFSGMVGGAADWAPDEPGG